MKTTLLSIAILLFATIACIQASAQTGSGASSSISATGSVEGQDPRVITNPDMREKLSADLIGRYSVLSNAPVLWQPTRNGFKATYSIGNIEYMSRYDSEGNFQRSYSKGNWREITSRLRNAFNKSRFRNKNVSGYWVALDSDQAYYLELSGKDGKTSNVFVDENGKFSTHPSDKD